MLIGIKEKQLRDNPNSQKQIYIPASKLVINLETQTVINVQGTEKRLLKSLKIDRYSRVRP